jgi:hypothetical protein
MPRFGFQVSLYQFYHRPWDHLILNHFELPEQHFEDSKR